MDLDDEDNSKKIADFISQMDTKKRRRTGDEEGNIKKRQLKEKSEAYKENEFNLPTHEEDDASKKLSLSDLMSTIEDDGTFGSLKTGLESLAGKGKNVTRRALSAPLAKRAQDRLERQAALEKATEEITKWEPTVQKLRAAEHLSFPMQDPTESHRATRTSAAMANKFKPETDLEKQISAALAEAGMKDEELEEFEALKLNKLSVAEIEERRKELRMMRELMFRHEIKNKRLKKIKSKSYRKLKRKEKERLGLQAKNSGLDEIDHELDDHEKMQAAISRAEERMTLKHKNTSKWARRALARGTKDEGTREAIMEQLRRGDELRRKIDGQESDEDSDEDEAENDEEYVNAALTKLHEEIDQDTQPKKGIFSMKFMQEAAKRQLDATKEDLAAFEKEWLAADSDDDNNKENEGNKEDNHTFIANNPGRMAFGAKAKQLKKPAQVKKTEDDDREGKEIIDEENETGMVTISEAGQIKKVSHSAAHNTRTSTHISLNNNNDSKKTSPLANLEDETESNPWLQADTSRLTKKASKNNVISSQTESRAEHSISKMNKTKKEKEKANDTTDNVELDLTKVLTIKSTQQTSKSKKSKEDSTSSDIAKVTHMKDDSDESEGEDDLDDNNATSQIIHKDKISFSQRELVARAFANDDVVAEFEDEKKAEIEEDADKVEDLTLPGWGSWAGAGVKENKKKKRIVKVTKGIDADKRKDAKLSHVIINEKINKKVEKYTATAVPFPYKTMEQYERSISTPLGSEWNTRQTFHRLTKPRVLTKLGKVIDPLKAPFS
ncbi:small-subunit processome [Cokeromyces recurvatus]|uniref:small-subunit processome n=1 Tax=Cokeromyces recurvatus TaxID=90255 RepID=UPI0022204FC7|nr:small-subunit processome [Cokeromyces recurvatus]KAI7902717.1 small-subunit processome [Cokeromyces recurvatus]